MPWILCASSAPAFTRPKSRLGFHPEGRWEKQPPSSFRLLAEFSSLWLPNSFVASLAVNQGYSVPRGHTQVQVLAHLQARNTTSNPKTLPDFCFLPLPPARENSLLRRGFCNATKLTRKQSLLSAPPCTDTV